MHSNYWIFRSARIRKICIFHEWIDRAFFFPCSMHSLLLFLSCQLLLPCSALQCSETLFARISSCIGCCFSPRSCYYCKVTSWSNACIFARVYNFKFCTSTDAESGKNCYLNIILLPNNCCPLPSTTSELYFPKLQKNFLRHFSFFLSDQFFDFPIKQAVKNKNQNSETINSITELLKNAREFFKKSEYFLQKRR